MTDDRSADPDRPLTLDCAPPRGAEAGAPEALRLGVGQEAPRPRGRALIATAVVAIVALAAFAVVVALRQTGSAPVAASSGEMAVEMAEPPPPPPLPEGGAPLEVLAPDMAAAADRSAEIARELAQQAPEVVPYQPQEEVAPTPQASFDCADARSLGEDMVCRDSGLAAADRELARSYRRALQAGVPAGQLRAEQQDWYEIREDAARRSPSAVSRIYAQRIEELNRLAEEFR